MMEGEGDAAMLEYGRDLHAFEGLSGDIRDLVGYLINAAVNFP
jgi:hypothetical protein